MHYITGLPAEKSNSSENIFAIKKRLLASTAVSTRLFCMYWLYLTAQQGDTCCISFTTQSAANVLIWDTWRLRAAALFSSSCSWSATYTYHTKYNVKVFLCVIILDKPHMLTVSGMGGSRGGHRETNRCSWFSPILSEMHEYFINFKSTNMKTYQSETKAAFEQTDTRL